MAKIYHPLGLVLPTTLGGKFLYRDICDAKLAWDAKLPSNLIQSWVRWEEGVNQVLVASRARLAKKGLTIPRLELVYGHVAANVLSNVSEALEGFRVSREVLLAR